MTAFGGKQLAKTYAVDARAQRAQAALEAQILEMLPIVQSEVLRYKLRVPRSVDPEELNGVAIGGLMRAMERWDGGDSETFGAYVRQRVRGAILDELRRMDVLSRGARKKAREYDTAVQRIEQREGHLASEDEVRAELGMEEGAFNALLEELRPVSFLSFDDTASSEYGGIGLKEQVEDANALDAGEKVLDREVVELLRERLEQLPDVQRKLMHMYYFKDFRLAEIAEVFGVSESRICQLHTQAIRSLRACMKRDMQS